MSNSGIPVINDMAANPVRWAMGVGSGGFTEYVVRGAELKNKLDNLKTPNPTYTPEPEKTPLPPSPTTQPETQEVLGAAQEAQKKRKGSAQNKYFSRSGPTDTSVSRRTLLGA